MNYDAQINALVEAIKADKAIIQPWRNRAVSHVLDGLACVRMGKTSIGAYAEKTYNTEPLNASNQNCSCPQGAKSRTCPVHGE